MTVSLDLSVSKCLACLFFVPGAYFSSQVIVFLPRCVFFVPGVFLQKRAFKRGHLLNAEFLVSFKNAPCKTRIDQVLNKRYDSPRFIYDNKFEIQQLPLPPHTN